VADHPLCCVEDRNRLAFAVGSGDLTRIVCGALRAVSLVSTREECFGQVYSLDIGGMSRLSAS
jgi:hypothetical protein